MAYKLVIYEKEDGIATLTLNRPDRLNAFIPPMRVETRKCIEDAAADHEVRALIVTGAGRAFCGGGDVTTHVDGRTDDEPAWAGSTLPLVEALRSLNKPSIAAVNGMVAATGAAFALACDIVIASDQAQFRVAYTRMGTAATAGVPWMMTRAIGVARTLELMYTNDVIDAKEMERIGLANRVVPHDELMKTAKEMAKRMMPMPPLTLASVKKVIYHTLGAHSLQDQVAFDEAVDRVAKNTEDHKEAMRSFLEKRDPVYKWR